MNALLRDLLDHQFWADAELWNAVSAHDAARIDKAIHDRYHHLHQVQRFFVWAVGDRTTQPSLTKPEDFASLSHLREYARESHDRIRSCLHSMSDIRLDQSIIIPWFREKPLTITVTEALTQLAMHSHHHRAQNATRLREVGGTPPVTDLIVWYSKGRPAGTL
jgi:uncharacterized damage-inducible protein DinB